MALTSVLPGSTGEFFGLPSSDYIEAVVLVANTAQYIQAPAGAQYVLFTSDGPFYLKMAATLAKPTLIVPNATTTDGSAGEASPTGRALPGERAWIGLIATAATVVCCSFFRRV